MKLARTFARSLALLVALAVTLPAVVSAPGCASILPGNDPVVVNSQRSVAAAFDTVDTFIRFDDAHRAELKQSAPAVHETAERLRRDAPAAFRQADAAVKTYKSVKSAENKSKLDTALDLIEAFARQARAALTDANTKGVGV